MRACLLSGGLAWTLQIYGYEKLIEEKYEKPRRADLKPCLFGRCVDGRVLAAFAKMEDPATFENTGARKGIATSATCKTDRRAQRKIPNVELESIKSAPERWSRIKRLTCVLIFYICVSAQKPEQNTGKSIWLMTFERLNDTKTLINTSLLLLLSLQRTLRLTIAGAWRPTPCLKWKSHTIGGAAARQDPSCLGTPEHNMQHTDFVKRKSISRVWKTYTACTWETWKTHAYIHTNIKRT